MTPIPDVAYYYPAPYWAAAEGGWVKSLLLFFDQVAILLPGYMYGRHHAADPSLAEPLEDQGLLQVLEPTTWVDQSVAEQLATVMVELLVAGAFDSLPDSHGFQGLSQSRIGYGADIGLADMLVEELLARNLARPSADGVSVPLHPVVRTTILMILGQLARAAGNRRGMAVHPATNDQHAAHDLLVTLAREPMPSAGNVVALDLEAVTRDLDPVPLDEVLDFRASHREAHTAYMRNLRGFLEELARVEVAQEREKLLLERRQELVEAAHALRTSARRAFAKNLGSWSLGVAGAAWSVAAHDPLGLAFTAAGLVTGAIPNSKPWPSAYSYVFAAQRQF